MRIIKSFNYCVFGSVLTISMLTHANEHIHSVDTNLQNTNLQNSHHDLYQTHVSEHQHGGEIYQITNFENAWYINDDQHGQYTSTIKSMIGTDENRAYINASLSKAESAHTTYNISAFYSRMLDDFWDGQVGLRYWGNEDIDQVDLVFGFHGLAPYFFESDIYVYVGQDQYTALGLSFERDLLLTQKLITQPYIEADLVFSDDSLYAKKTGLSELKTGLKTRYEINKRVKPFVDIGYVYEKGSAATSNQIEEKSDTSWQYGLGFEIVF